jgi:hypothetical protein
MIKIMEIVILMGKKRVMDIVMPMEKISRSNLKIHQKNALSHLS